MKKRSSLMFTRKCAGICGFICGGNPLQMNYVGIMGHKESSSTMGNGRICENCRIFTDKCCEFRPEDGINLARVPFNYSDDPQAPLNSVLGIIAFMWVLQCICTVIIWRSSPRMKLRARGEYSKMARIPPYTRNRYSALFSFNSPARYCVPISQN